MGDNPVGKLLRSVEGGAYWVAVAPAWPVCRPSWATASHAGAATCSSGARPEAHRAVRNVRLVLGDELRPAAAQRVVRDWFRLASCSTADVKRLRHGARPLRRLIENPWAEHLEAALAAGKEPSCAPLISALTPAARRCARQRFPRHSHRALGPQL